VECEALVVFVDDSCGDLFVDDSLEDCLLGHGVRSCNDADVRFAGRTAGGEAQSLVSIILSGHSRVGGNLVSVALLDSRLRGNDELGSGSGGSPIAAE
jgi:hypothetical protein